MSMRLAALPAGDGLRGEITLPGDKSVSHRSLMFAAIANGVSEIDGLLEGEDCLATAAAMREMGVSIERTGAGRFVVRGCGLRGLSAPARALDLGNSGTAMRLLCGLLAGQAFGSTMVGDASLSSRPMRRVTDPLNAMGANIRTVDGHAPLTISPVTSLTGIDYAMPIASAQLKSALLIAGLYAASPVRVQEPGPSRDHTERMLAAMGATVVSERDCVTIHPAQGLEAINISVPADLSSAAFFIVAASIVPGSQLRLKQVGINPTRSGVIDILRQMGADIRCEAERDCGGEPVADIVVQSATLTGAVIDPSLVPLAIDEFPVLFVAAAVADGTSHFSGLAELRHKESDRISTMTTGLRALGVQVAEGEDWVRITGGALDARAAGQAIESHGDHRIAMAFAIAAAVANAGIEIADPENIATSFPNFVDLANRCGLRMALIEG